MTESGAATKGTKGVTSILEEVSGLLSQLEKLQRILTIMFTDIAGSTSYFERHGDMMGMVMLQKVESILRPLVGQYDGHVVKTIGDSVMAYFDNPVRAVQCAVVMQRALAEHNRRAAEMEPVQIRVAINLGVALLRGNDVFGDVVNVCSRIEHAAKPGQICVSPSVVEAVLGRADITCRPVGSVEMRGKAQKMDLYEVDWQGGESAAGAPAAELSGEQLALATGSAGGAPQELRTMIARAVSGDTTVSVLSAPKKTFALVEILPARRVGERFALKDPCTVVGSEQADIVLADPRVAAQHATFTALGGALYVDDVSDGRGVFVRVRKPHRLADGEQVAMGRIRFRFCATPAEGEGPREVELKRVDADGQDERYPLERGETSIGRKDCTYTFPEDRYLSRLHARFLFFGTQCVLEDLGSSNGTFLAIRERHGLNEGDDVLIGEKVLRVTTEESE